MRVMLPIVAAVVASGLGLGLGPAAAKNEIQKECSTKYQAAKAANQLNGQTYNQYYKACAAAAKASPAAPAPTPTAAPAPGSRRSCTGPDDDQQSGPAARRPAAAGSAVFPTALSSDFSKESAGKARMHTCLAQYKANKTTNGNGGLKWIEKGGGYYSECNKRLKG